jgi:mannosyl-oligosaccharide glucosidase
LLGGIGYYYGPIRIKKDDGGYYYDEPAGLLTGTPSRSNFPRGFLWDEGFHLMLTCQWSRFLCMDILSHWFNSMKPNGWIPREQIRGPEAESVAPEMYIAQDPSIANPPSMMFPMKYLVYYANNGETRAAQFLRKFYPRWRLWYSWFFESQENPSVPFTFSWRGGAPLRNLPSGLDDYPRDYLIHTGEEMHLDL